jgi:hypothetical protein
MDAGSGVGPLQVDATGHPHTSYIGAEGVYYAVLLATDWVKEIVDTSQTYSSPAMAIDGTNKLHVTYQEFPSGQWRHTYQTESGWSTESITMAVTSLAVDVSGNLHLVYNDPEGNLAYAYQADNQWHTEVITQPFVGPVHLILDQQQTPHIAFYTALEGPLNYAYRNGNDWFIQAVDSNIAVAFTSLQLDSLNQPHLVYASSNQDLIYAHWQGSQWISETLDSVVFSAWLALDSQDHPHIAYSHQYGFTQFEYMYWTGNGWSSETIDPFYAIPYQTIYR